MSSQHINVTLDKWMDGRKYYGNNAQCKNTTWFLNRTKSGMGFSLGLPDKTHWVSRMCTQVFQACFKVFYTPGPASESVSS